MGQYDLWSDDFDKTGSCYWNLPHPDGVTQSMFDEILMDLEGNCRDLEKKEVKRSAKFYSDVYNVRICVEYFLMLERVSWCKKGV